MQTGREQTVVHAMFQWIFFLAPRHEKQPPQSPLSGGGQFPLIRGARRVKYFLLASGH